MQQVSNSLHQQLIESTLEEIFGIIDEDIMARVRPWLTTHEVPGGDVLMRQGEPSDAVYMVLSGRLRAMLSDEKGGVTPLGEIGRGEPIGEMGVIGGQPRSATVVALRDSVLLRMEARCFTDLLQSWPHMALPLARKVIERLTQTNQGRSERKRIVNICLAPLHDGLDARDLARRLRSALETQLARGIHPEIQDRFPIAVIDRQTVDGVLGQGTADLGAEQGEAHRALLRWLDEQEGCHAMQVFVADSGDTPWTRLCLRHADHILLVADADGPRALTEVETRYLGGGEASPALAIRQSLWLLHPTGRRTPQHTQQWLAPRPYLTGDGLSHFHTRLDNAGDWARLARLLTGQATGIVLAGGGARGFAHLGVMQALAQENIEWDMAGGTSIGAVMAAYAAMDLPPDAIIPMAERAFAVNPTGDINWFPFISVIRGLRLKRVIHDAVVAALGANIDIEDLWKPYFCISSNYSRAQMEVLRKGNLAKSITASVSIPAALPPVLWNGDLLTDGGTFNNYPVDVMRASGAGRVIGVDLSRDRYHPLTIEAMPSNLALFVDKFLRPSRRRRYKGLPSIAAVVFNVAAMASTSHEKRMRELADLAFTPDVSRVGMLEWKAFHRIVDIGRLHARERLEETRDRLLEHRWFAVAEE